MDQVKYPLYACLILLTAVAGILFLRFISTASWYKSQKTQTIDYVTATQPGMDSYGKRIFQQNCASCHAFDKVITGPALRGVASRGPWLDSMLLKKWIKNAPAFLPTNQYTRGLQKQYGSLMTNFSNTLSDADIDAVIVYITQQPVQAIAY